MGMLGAREMAEGEAPALHSMVERLAARAGVVKPRLYVLADSYPRALSAGRGAGGGSGLALSVGLLGVASPAELEGIVAHEIAHLRHRDVLVQTVSVRRRHHGRRDLPDRRRAAARAPDGARAARGSVRAPHALAEARVRGRPARRRAVRLAARARGRAAAARAGDGARRPSRRARPASRSTRRTRSPTRAWRRSSRPIPPVPERRAPAARARPRLAREATRCLERHGSRTTKSPLRGSSKKWAASYSPGGLLPEYHRR